MHPDDLSSILIEQKVFASKFLKRDVVIDFYLPKNISTSSPLSLLVINDGQNLDEMHFASILNGLLSSSQIQPLLCVGIHCSKDRIDEYGTATCLDYEGRGKKALAYQQFIVKELVPFIHLEYAVESFHQKAIAGFSMGGLSAIDTLFNYAGIFSTVGVFSGSLWWRSKDLQQGYHDDRDRIMHQLIKKTTYCSELRFYFTTGAMDETADRNNNGVIDSIDDTLDLISELKILGYEDEKHICYINYEDGRHDILTWGKAMPQFLLWMAGSLNLQGRSN